MADLACPGCNVKFLSLTELDGHLDKAHPVLDTTLPKINDRTSLFSKIRTQQLAKRAIIRTKLEMRLVKLLFGLQKLTSAGGSTSSFWNWQEVRAINEFERQIVNWEDESVFERCRFCGQRFSFFSRRHHCRVCGLVTCGDAERECSFEVPANLIAEKLIDLHEDFPELRHVTTLYPIRLCTECRSQLLSHRNFLADKSSQWPVFLRLHFQLKRIQDNIEKILPIFEKSLASLASADVSSQGLLEIRKTRRKLLQRFSDYEKVSTKLRDCEVETETEIRIRQQILAKAAGFLETRMLPLQSLPQAMRYNEKSGPDKTEAQNLQQQLLVLEEQRYLLEKEVEKAKLKRHFDALPPLEMSLKEISTEATRLNVKLGQYAPTT